MFNVGDIASILNVLFTVTAVTALAWVFNRQKSRDLSELQSKIIETQRQSMAAQDTRIADLERTAVKLNQTIATIQAILRKRGIVVRIEGDYVTIETGRGGDSKQTTARILKQPKPSNPQDTNGGDDPQENVS